MPGQDRIDWNHLAAELALITITDGGRTERGGTVVARQALERLIGPAALRASVDYYVTGQPGFELARSVLWLLHPVSAMERCHEIYSTSDDVEERRSAVELLRVVGDGRVLEWTPEYLADADPVIQMWAIGIVDQLLFSNLADIDDCCGLLDKAEGHPNQHVREKAQEIRQQFERD